MDSVDIGDYWKFREVQWCDHVRLIDGDNVRGYTIAQFEARDVDLLVGQGIVRVMCKACTPVILAKLFNASISAS